MVETVSRKKTANKLK